MSDWYKSSEEAKKLLVHYFERAISRTITSDHVNEIESIVDHILDAAKAQTVEGRLEELEREVKALKSNSNEYRNMLKKVRDRLNALPGSDDSVSQIAEDIADYFHD